ncbi:hypothetical protein Pelo_14594 [Pelomyxa schiedti]|nr:hypothetical protein Pelo_14594 [Pelomyxa schiedti]
MQEPGRGPRLADSTECSTAAHTTVSDEEAEGGGGEEEEVMVDSEEDENQESDNEDIPQPDCSNTTQATTAAKNAPQATITSSSNIVVERRYQPSVGSAVLYWENCPPQVSPLPLFFSTPEFHEVAEHISSGSSCIYAVWGGEEVPSNVKELAQALHLPYFEKPFSFLLSACSTATVLNQQQLLHLHQIMHFTHCQFAEEDKSKFQTAFMTLDHMRTSARTTVFISGPDALVLLHSGLPRKVFKSCLGSALDSSLILKALVHFFGLSSPIFGSNPDVEMEKVANLLTGLPYCFEAFLSQVKESCQRLIMPSLQQYVLNAWTQTLQHYVKDLKAQQHDLDAFLHLGGSSDWEFSSKTLFFPEGSLSCEKLKAIGSNLNRCGLLSVVPVDGGLLATPPFAWTCCLLPNSLLQCSEPLNAMTNLKHAMFCYSMATELAKPWSFLWRDMLKTTPYRVYTDLKPNCIWIHKSVAEVPLDSIAFEKISLCSWDTDLCNIVDFRSVALLCTELKRPLPLPLHSAVNIRFSCNVPCSQSVALCLEFFSYCSATPEPVIAIFISDIPLYKEPEYLTLEKFLHPATNSLVEHVFFFSPQPFW